LFNNTTPRANPINLGLNSTIANNTTTTAVVVQSQTKNNDSISFKTTLESIAPPAGTFLTPPSLLSLIYYKSLTLLLVLEAHYVLLMIANKKS
jgi:hypothetical protein